MFYYFPLEPYPERYTFQLSSPQWGWAETALRKAGVEYTRIEGQRSAPENIQTGVVLDAFRRSQWCFDQIGKFLQLLSQGKVPDKSILYFEDFWHPGIEAIRYTLWQLRSAPTLRCFATLWAQSVDEFDFTHSMRWWMRHYEKGNAAVLDGIFVADTCLQELVVLGGIAEKFKVHPVGLPFDSSEVGRRLPTDVQREDKVVFSSRWDLEKNPQFFLEVARLIKANRPEPTKFVVTSSAPALRSNRSTLLNLAQQAEKDGIIEIKAGLTKDEYYAELRSAKIQFNCANQDFVSFTLLEAAVAGCLPVYPYFRSFPEALDHQHRYLYQHLDPVSAAVKIRTFLEHEDSNLWSDLAMRQRSWIYARHDQTWSKMLKIMQREEL